MHYNYNSRIAVMLGVNSALAADCLRSRLETNYEIIENRKWVRCSGAMLSAIYPHMKKRSASRALEKLAASGLVVRKAFNQSRFDSTFYYSFTDYGEQLARPDGHEA